MNLIIDIGNTWAKIAVFNKNSIITQEKVKPIELNSLLESLLLEHPVKAGIISSVGKTDKNTLPALQQLSTLLWLDADTKVPFTNLYETPKTLGVDRIALVSAAVHQFNHKNVLIIDAGTCITFDFVNSEQQYLGGAISPGINLRFKALHAYTAKLPLLKPTNFELTGATTEKSMQSGVLNGVILEIEGIISQYSTKYSNLTVILTGGDTIYLAEKLKSSIFATPNFLLEGLNRILIHNIHD